MNFSNLNKDQKKILRDHSISIMSNISLIQSCGDTIKELINELIASGIINKDQKTQFKKVLTDEVKAKALTDNEIDEQADNYKIVRDFLDKEINNV